MIHTQHNKSIIMLSYLLLYLLLGKTKTVHIFIYFADPLYLILSTSCLPKTKYLQTINEIESLKVKHSMFCMWPISFVLN